MKRDSLIVMSQFSEVTRSAEVVIARSYCDEAIYFKVATKGLLRRSLCSLLAMTGKLHLLLETNRLRLITVLILHIFFSNFSLFSIQKINLAYIQSKTVANIGIDEKLMKSFLKRSRYKNSLPEIKFSVNRGISKVISISQESYDFNADIRDDNDIGFEASLAWDLSKILFNVDSLRVVQKIEDAAILKKKNLEEVTRLYFEREKLIKSGDDELKILEVTAKINILCGNCVD